MSTHRLSFVLALVMLAACRRESCASHAAARPGAPKCFNVVVDDNSAKTTAIFEANECQGGGVTWAAILGAIAARKGTSESFESHEDDDSEWTGEVRLLHAASGQSFYAIDDEGDAALFCTDSDALLAEVKADVARANADGAALERLMHESDREALECERLDAPAPSSSAAP